MICPRTWGTDRKASGPCRKVRSATTDPPTRGPDMEDGRCKLGLQGRLELVRLIDAGATFRAAAAAVGVAPATAHRWWHRWRGASEADRQSRACLRTRSPRPRSCPWSLSAEAEALILRVSCRSGGEVAP